MYKRKTVDKHTLFQVIDGKDILMSEHISIEAAKGRAKICIHHGGRKKEYVVVDKNTNERFVFKNV